MAIESDNLTWISQYKSLVEILDTAEKWDINPGKLIDAPISNLCDIIFEAKKAINREDKERLNEIFRLASEEKNRSLRIKLRGSNREKIKVNKEYKEKIPVFHLYLDKEQFTRIEKETEHIYDYHIIE